MALQLTNILRDVREDARTGRDLSAQEDLERFGVGPEDLTADRPERPPAGLLAFEGRRAYDYLRRGRPR